MSDLLTICKAESERSLRRVIPDLVGVPLYVATRSEIPTILGGAMVKSGCGGAYHETLDLALQGHFLSCNVWRGRGPCLYIDDDSIFEHFHSEAIAREQFRAVAIHEVCHALAADEWPADMPDKKQHAEPLADGLAFWCEIFHPEKPKAPKYHPIPWAMHGPRFIRACIHVVKRMIAQRDGLHLGSTCVAGPYYGLSSHWSYADALADEPEQLAHLPIRSILATPPPVAFTALWEKDTEGATP